MSSLKLLHTHQLLNGLKVSIYDNTKLYFGDYHHVRVKIICSFCALPDDFEPAFPADFDLGSLSYIRNLERMGVPSADVDNVVNSLLVDFNRNALPYIASSEFPKRIIKNELFSKKNPARKYQGSVS